MALLNRPSISDVHRVVVAGCSYGGMSTVMNILARVDNATYGPGAAPNPNQKAKLKRNVEITVIDERDGFFHLVGTPLAHTSRSHVRPFWRSFRSIPHFQRPEIKVNRGRVTRIDPARKTLTFADAEDSSKESQVEYDYFVLATGMSRDFPSAPRKLLKKEYAEDSFNHISGIEKIPGGHIVVIGGGAVGIEIAAEVKHNHPSQRVTLIHSRNELLSNEPLPSDFKERALIILGEEGVDVKLNQRAIVETTENAEETVSTITLSNGEKITANHIIWATSKNVPNTNCIPQEILDDNGFVKVTQELHFEDGVANPTSHFAIGDVIHREGGIRRAGGALFMGRIAAVNIYRDMLRADGVEDDTPADIFPHFGPVMGLAVGSQMVGYTGEMGIKWGREYMAENFGTDLGWKGTLRHLGLPEEDEADGKKAAEL